MNRLQKQIGEDECVYKGEHFVLITVTVEQNWRPIDSIKFLV